MIRGARTENGQIILQNGHDLLSLLNSGAVSIANSEDDKRTSNTSNSSSILLHRKATTTPKLSTESNKFVIQSTLNNAATITGSQIADANTLNGNGLKNNALLNSTQAIKNATTSNTLSTSTSTSAAATTTNIPEGSIIFQQRLNKNGANDGPILLQTLKRIDKSPSILLFRNNQTTGTTSTCTLTATAAQNVVKTKPINNRIAVLANNNDDEKAELKLRSKSMPSNVPLGAGK